MTQDEDKELTVSAQQGGDGASGSESGAAAELKPASKQDEESIRTAESESAAVQELKSESKTDAPKPKPKEKKPEAPKPKPVLKPVKAKPELEETPAPRPKRPAFTFITIAEYRKRRLLRAQLAFDEALGVFMRANPEAGRLLESYALSHGGSLGTAAYHLLFSGGHANKDLLLKTPLPAAPLIRAYRHLEKEKQMAPALESEMRLQLTTTKM